MLANTKDILIQARRNGYAVGAFNIYNLEGATAVVQAAQEMKSPVILQVLPRALKLGGRPLCAMCREMARYSAVPVAVHLDHCSVAETIFFALDCGFSSVMADGSALEYEENIRFTREIVRVNRARFEKGSVEAELGRLSGAEDGLSIDEREACLTSIEQAADFVRRTEIDALAVCIGNIHGTYEKPPELDFPRLAAIAERVSIPLVLHGTSGLPDEMISTAIAHGVCKFNVNTEVRKLYVESLSHQCADSKEVELIQLMENAIAAMKKAVLSKIELFCSAGRA